MGTVSTEQDGITYTIPDTDKPVWFGPYANGKLAVYEASVVGENVIPDSVTYVASYFEDDGKEFCAFTVYKKDVPVQFVLNDIFSAVFNAYQADCAKESVQPATSTIH